jgi:mRNA interferase RelE/StbE
VNLGFTRSFAKDLRTLQPRFREQIRQVIEQVEQAPSLQEVSNLKKLHGHPVHYRIRVGDYRVGLTAEGNEVTFVRVLHRKDIYRLFP